MIDLFSVVRTTFLALAITLAISQTSNLHAQQPAAAAPEIEIKKAGAIATYENSLAMKFVPVPGTQVFMCIHETRNKDYAAYVAATKNSDKKWKNPTFDLGDRGKFNIHQSNDHPVVNVYWTDARLFCEWLSKKDGRTFRLPTDHEWSCAVGIGDQEKATDTPESKSGKISGYPWGDSYPPSMNSVGNYWDTAIENEDKSGMGAYSDGQLLTAPVMSYSPNKLGIYDLGGNVWEWCDDAYNPTAKLIYRVLRGGSWGVRLREHLAASYRYSCPANDRYLGFGFRCVVER